MTNLAANGPPVMIRTNIAATSPVNAETNPAVAGRVPCFYRIELE